MRVSGLLIGGRGSAHQKGGRDRKATVRLLVFAAGSWGVLPENVGPNTLRLAHAVRMFPLSSLSHADLGRKVANVICKIAVAMIKITNLMRKIVDLIAKMAHFSCNTFSLHL